MSLFRLSNHIFELGLDAQELSVYAYLCSLPADTRTITGKEIVKVKQSTIGQCCGLRSLQTVARVLKRLAAWKLVEPLERAYKRNKQKGTYSYAVRKLPTDCGYFLMERRVFGQLVPRQVVIYLFLCKSFNPTLNDCWNSYNDISAQTGMKRESVIQTIRELIEMKLIYRSRRRSRDNRRVYVDNHYSIVRFEVGHILEKQPKMRQSANFVEGVTIYYPAVLCRICPEVRSAVWGSP